MTPASHRIDAQLMEGLGPVFRLLKCQGENEEVVQVYRLNEYDQAVEELRRQLRAGPCPYKKP